MEASEHSWEHHQQFDANGRAPPAVVNEDQAPMAIACGTTPHISNSVDEVEIVAGVVLTRFK